MQLFLDLYTKVNCQKQVKTESFVDTSCMFLQHVWVILNIYSEGQPVLQVLVILHEIMNTGIFKVGLHSFSLQDGLV